MLGGLAEEGLEPVRDGGALGGVDGGGSHGADAEGAARGDPRRGGLARRGVVELDGVRRGRGAHQELGDRPQLAAAGPRDRDGPGLVFAESDVDLAPPQRPHVRVPAEDVPDAVPVRHERGEGVHGVDLRHGRGPSSPLRGARGRTEPPQGGQGHAPRVPRELRRHARSEHPVQFRGCGDGAAAPQLVTHRIDCHLQRRVAALDVRGAPGEAVPQHVEVSPGRGTVGDPAIPRGGWGWDLRRVVPDRRDRPTVGPADLLLGGAVGPPCERRHVEAHHERIEVHAVAPHAGETKDPRPLRRGPVPLQAHVGEPPPRASVPRREPPAGVSHGDRLRERPPETQARPRGVHHGLGVGRVEDEGRQDRLRARPPRRVLGPVEVRDRRHEVDLGRVGVVEQLRRETVLTELRGLGGAVVEQLGVRVRGVAALEGLADCLSRVSDRVGPLWPGCDRDPPRRDGVGEGTSGEDRELHGGPRGGEVGTARPAGPPLDTVDRAVPSPDRRQEPPVTGPDHRTPRAPHGRGCAHFLVPYVVPLRWAGVIRRRVVGGPSYPYLGPDRSHGGRAGPLRGVSDRGAAVPSRARPPTKLVQRAFPVVLVGRFARSHAHTSHARSVRAYARKRARGPPPSAFGSIGLLPALCYKWVK